MSRSRRCLSVIGLVTLLAAQGAWALAPRMGSAPSPMVPLHQVFAFFVEWSGLSGAWLKEGCKLDPHGQCLPNGVSTPDAGCSVDAYGQCEYNSSGSIGRKGAFFGCLADDRTCSFIGTDKGVLDGAVRGSGGPPRL